ncbi:MAG: T9SS type A sorting domain-containing protein [Candidatus Cloacimonetes bacterium]|nr:T9SS type A sorting domain-containing protein [Candidatus Cloacimonadota bacterium]
MQTISKYVGLTILLALCTGLSAFSGHITSNTVWSEDIIITGDVWIDAGVTLTIDAGVTVSFTRVDMNSDGIGDTDFFVDGRLLSQGAALDPVVFTSNEDTQQPGDWAGFDFRNTAAVHSNLTNTEIYYGFVSVDINAKYIDFTGCVVAYSQSLGVRILDSHDGLVTVNGLVIFENGNDGLTINSNGLLSATGLVSSSNAGIGIACNSSDDIIIGDSRSVSNAEQGVFIDGGSPQFTNTDISHNGEDGVYVEGAAAPTFSYCTISNNGDFGCQWGETSTGEITYSEIINNDRAGFWVFGGSLPVVNYCNIYGNATDTSSYIFTENIPSNELYVSYSGTSSNYTIMRPVNMISQIYVSGYGDHNSSYDDYAFYVYTSSGSNIYSNIRNNTSSDTNFALWHTVNSSSSNHALYVNLNTYSVTGAWGRVSKIRYDLSDLQYQFATVNPSGVIDAMYNWWGQVNGVDGLVYQGTPSTVSYEGLQVAPVATAGATLPNDGPIFSVETPADMVIDPADFTIEWYDVDVEDDALIDLYYDTTQDTAGTLIVSGISEDEATDAYLWTLVDVPHDIYYIYGVIDDGVNAPVVSYAPGRVQVGPLSAGVPLDAHGEADESIQIPIEIVNSWDYYGIISFQFTLTFNHTLLTATGVTTAGTLSETWTVNHNNGSPGQIQVNGYTTTALETDGVLVYIDFDVAPGIADYENCALSFSEWIFNDGAATVVQNNGLFTVLNRYVISGTVDYYSNAVAVNGADLLLEGVESDSVDTGVSGDYAFTAHLAGNYDLTPVCDNAIPDLTVTPYDASLTARNALGLITFDANEETAADVNDDGTPTVYDAALIAQYSVGLITEFDAGAWAFDPESHSFELVGGNTTKDFAAIVIGDPSGNYPGGAERQIPDIWAVPVTQRDAEFVGLVIHYDDAFYSFLAALDYNTDAVEFLEARLSEDLDDFQLAVHDDEGSLRAGAFGAEAALTTDGAVTLVFRVLDEELLGTAFDVSFITFDEEFGGYIETTDADGEDVTPLHTGLAQNFPNPFNPTTTIVFSLAAPQRVSIEVFNIRGQHVATLVDERREAGEHRLTWNADGHASGIYFCRLKAGDTVDVKKMILIK